MILKPYVRASLSALATAFLTLNTGSAMATPSLILSGAITTGVQGLDINGKLYDAHFHATSFADAFSTSLPTFLNDEKDAIAAADALVSVLNLYDVFNLGPDVGPGDALMIPTYDSELEPLPTFSYSAGECLYRPNTMGSVWQGNCTYMGGTNGSKGLGVFVSFDQTNAVPEPGVLALAILGLGGLAATRQKRVAAN
jgi:hypothetical protein